LLKENHKWTYTLVGYAWKRRLWSFATLEFLPDYPRRAVDLLKTAGIFYQ